jgi:hypothetical protein
MKIAASKETPRNSMCFTYFVTEKHEKVEFGQDYFF